MHWAYKSLKIVTIACYTIVTIKQSHKVRVKSWKDKECCGWPTTKPNLWRISPLIRLWVIVLLFKIYSNEGKVSKTTYAGRN
jgi:hypothetical protein